MGGTLLLADDSITIQKVVELETEHTVVAVGNGRDLLARLEQVKPDVILCDVVMPDLNGYDICQRIKSDPATLHIPVVLLTGTFEPFDRDRALASGCDSIVTKPFEAKELIATVEDLLQRAQALGEHGAGDAGGVPGDYAVPDGVQGIDFTTTGFERLAPPPRAELPPVEGVEMTLSSFQSQISAPAPPPPPELADDSGADLARRPAAAAPRAAADGSEELLTPSPEDQTTPSGPVPTPEERRAAALALLEEVGTRAAGAAFAPPPTFSFVDSVEPEAFAEPEPPAPPAPPAPAPVVAPLPVPAVAPVAAAPVLVEAPRVEPAAAVAPATASAPRELSQDEVDRIARRVLELADTLIERIAWEVIPDMAEMMVRQRIRELEEAAEEES